jgi:hypothetical protein
MEAYGWDGGKLSSYLSTHQSTNTPIKRTCVLETRASTTLPETQWKRSRNAAEPHKVEIDWRQAAAPRHIDVGMYCV